MQAGDDFSKLLQRLQTDLTGLVNTLASLRDYAPRSGRPLTGTIVAGTLAVTLPHGLQRPYVGMEVRHAANLATQLVADTPGADSDRTIRIYIGAVQANDVTFTVWVY